MNQVADNQASARGFSRAELQRAERRPDLLPRLWPPSRRIIKLHVVSAASRMLAGAFVLFGCQNLLNLAWPERCAAGGLACRPLVGLAGSAGETRCSSAGRDEASLRSLAPVVI